MAAHSSATTVLDESIDQLRSELNTSQNVVAQLQQDKIKMEMEFDYKRAKIKDLYYAKENIIREQSTKLHESERQINTLESTISKLQEEIDNIKMIAAVSENTKEEAVEDLNKHHHEEIKSLRCVLQESMEEQRRDLVLQFEQERRHWESEINKLKKELDENNDKLLLQQEEAKAKEEEELEVSMQQAQTEAETLRAVVVPLEKEISKLKEKLQQTEEQLAASRKDLELTTQNKLKMVGDEMHYFQNSSQEDEKRDAVEHKAVMDGPDLSHFKTMSQFNIEQHVKEIDKEKDILQRENDTLKVEMHEVCRMLEYEQTEHNILKETWSVANDQFLDSQQLLMNDLEIVKSVLSESQWIEVKSLQCDGENKERMLVESAQIPRTDVTNTEASAFQETLKDDVDSESFSSFQGHVMPGEIPMSATTLPTEYQDTISLNSVSSMPSSVSLIPSEDHKSALGLSSVSSAPQLNLLGIEENSKAVHEINSKFEPNAWDEVPPSNLESFEPTHGEAHAAKRESSSEQECVKLREKVSELQKLLEKENSLRRKTEELVMQTSDDAKDQISDLSLKLTKLEKIIEEDKSWRKSKETEDDKRLSQLLKDKDKIYEDYLSLKKEQELFRNSYRKHRTELKRDDVLPTSAEGLKQHLFKYREALLYAEVQKKQSESKLQSRLNFLQDRLKAEQVAREQLEITLTSELEDARREITSLHDVKSQLEKEISNSKQLQIQLGNEQSSLESIRSKSKEIIKGLKEKLKSESSVKEELENKLAATKNQLRSLQDALETSEHVQQDFVRLSQSLQMRLEEIRQKEESEKPSVLKTTSTLDSNGALHSGSPSNHNPG
ncbi:rab GTPase-binding effector protein 1-like isoform X1 [Clavelina lepadiformis]|uniref:rab GTPase-binding effector protein 1-like isoform X1 n=1 Tax=Clavelina lepadiformis TaxID=159417 RepID=UPI0040425E4B